MRKMILAGADLAQVEAKIELMLAAGTPEFYGTDIGKECIRLAQAHPAEFDIHRYSGAITFDKAEADVTADERQDGKSFMHGFMRGMGAQKLCNELLKKRGIVITPETAEYRLGRLRMRLPAIPDGFFPDVRRQIMRFFSLGTTYGGIWRCNWQRLEEPLYAKGYSYQPVRETQDLINQNGFLPLCNAIKVKRLSLPATYGMERVPRIHVHGHDSLTMSVHPDDAYMVLAFLEKTLGGVVRYYAAGALKVPVTYSLGENWKTRFEFKKLPSKKEVREAAYACAEAE
jgi:hypothetical protein